MLEDEYKNHKIFSELTEYIDFYENLSFAIFPIITPGAKALGVDSYLISSIQGTIESIKLVLSDGKISDAYALARKYHDAIVIHCYVDQYLKDNFRIDNLVVENVYAWIQGKKALPRYESMINYIRKARDLEKINSLLDLDRYQKIRERCNDFTHCNSFKCMLINDGRIYSEDRLGILNKMLGDLRDFFIKHFVWLFTQNKHFMASSDYLDSLECGITPEEGTQYLVAPFVQDIFNDIIKTNRIDLANELLKTTFMKLE